MSLKKCVQKYMKESDLKIQVNKKEMEKECKEE